MRRKISIEKHINRSYFGVTDLLRSIVRAQGYTWILVVAIRGYIATSHRGGLPLHPFAAGTTEGPTGTVAPLFSGRNPYFYGLLSPGRSA